MFQRRPPIAAPPSIPRRVISTTANSPRHARSGRAATLCGRIAKEGLFGLIGLAHIHGDTFGSRRDRACSPVSRALANSNAAIAPNSPGRPTSRPVRARRARRANWDRRDRSTRPFASCSTAPRARSGSCATNASPVIERYTFSVSVDEDQAHLRGGVDFIVLEPALVGRETRSRPLRDPAGFHRPGAHAAVEAGGHHADAGLLDDVPNPVSGPSNSVMLRQRLVPVEVPVRSVPPSILRLTLPPRKRDLRRHDKRVGGAQPAWAPRRRSPPVQDQN